MSPAEWVVKQFGSLRKTASAIGRDFSAVAQWKRKGTIPAPAQQIILVKAKELGLDILPADLVVGRRVEADEYTEKRNIPADAEPETSGNRQVQDPNLEGDAHL
jgi:hypothetical protein